MRFTVADLAKHKAYVDLLFANAPLLTVYLGSMESATSSSTTEVTVTNAVRRVASVWLASDSERKGTNYYADQRAENFVGSVITLDAALPGATIKLDIAYYSDCADCGWDDFAKTGRDAGCATCGGLGMTLASGDVQTVPVRPVDAVSVAEEVAAFGPEVRGRVALRVQGRYENMVKAAIQLKYEERELVPYVDMSGAMTIRRLYSATGECNVFELLTRFKDLQ